MAILVPIRREQCRSEICIIYPNFNLIYDFSPVSWTTILKTGKHLVLLRAGINKYFNILLIEVETGTFIWFFNSYKSVSTIMGRMLHGIPLDIKIKCIRTLHSQASEGDRH